MTILKMLHENYNHPIDTPLDTLKLQVDRSLIHVQGEDASKFLQGILTQDIRKLSIHNSIYSAMLTPQGKYITDFFVIYCAEDSMYIDVSSDSASHLYDILTMYKLNCNVNLTYMTCKVHLVFSKSLVENYINVDKKNNGYTVTYTDATTIIVDPRNNHLGLRLYNLNAPYQIGTMDESDNVSKELANIHDGNINEYDYLRISLKIPSAKSELIPYTSYITEVGFIHANGVSFDKGCYIGQEVVARMRHKTTPRKSLYRIHSTTMHSPLQSGSDILQHNHPIGKITSASSEIGLAILDNRKLDLKECCRTQNDIALYISQ